MKYRTRTFYTDKQKSEMWDRWQRGESLSSIGRHFNRASSSIFPHLAQFGGIRPPQRRRSRWALSLTEREEIFRGLVAQQSFRSIVQSLNRSPSTISREVGRNGGRQTYRAARSDQRAWDCAKRPKACKLSFNEPLCRFIARKLRLKWSPQQIAGWLMRRHPDEERERVSHETIYRSLYVQTRGVLKKELQECLRSPRAIRRSRHATQKGLKLRKIKDAIPISERPPEVEDRAIPGHWEGDLIVGSNNSYIVTLVERHSRFVMLAKVENKDTQSVITALIKQARKLPKDLYRSLTWDRGSEMAGHRKFTMATKIDVYFCDPQSPWQRGSNENTNRLLRQYFPKGLDISGFSQAELSAVARQLNERPRKTLQYQTPTEKFEACVAATR
ncbi:Transposase and inactivated derivatives, IS30 family [Shimia gijangensis]|uniref:Transposase and inactivated derivatives, IS30 family n=1 Tax=Shimia gijangensis TaxID=1470563 RepID=A0A1M6J8M0_9RHOB|nr:IS30 family transposase [Shimia gijangensis]SHJ43000.1 Transposase and inactivated derivatives, IS30 family [Shimia gijangensis]